jgi:hypothetical protein
MGTTRDLDGEKLFGHFSFQHQHEQPIITFELKSITQQLAEREKNGEGNWNWESSSLVDGEGSVHHGQSVIPYIIRETSEVAQTVAIPFRVKVWKLCPGNFP